MSTAEICILKLVLLEFQKVCVLYQQKQMGIQCVRKRKMFVLFVYTVIFINIVKYILSILISLTVKINAFSLYKTLQLHTGTFNETDHLWCVHAGGWKYFDILFVDNLDMAHLGGEQKESFVHMVANTSTDTQV